VFGIRSKQANSEDLARLPCAQGERLEQACAGDEDDKVRRSLKRRVY
jgi:hypothetical protein